MKTSLIIATYNRHKKLFECLESVLKNTLLPFEIIIVDQSKGNFPFNKINIDEVKIRYLKLTRRGLSRARNLAIQKAQGDILLFTDDDCIVPRKWVEKIEEIFKKDPKIQLIYGRVLPYHPKKNKDRICPSTRVAFKKRTITIDGFSGMKKTDFVIGNNFACRRELFDKVGLFLTWLGVGSIGHGGSESELCLRLLERNIPYKFIPTIKVYHNRWISRFSYSKLEIYYTRPWIAMWTYYHFKTRKFRYLTWNALKPVIGSPISLFKTFFLSLNPKNKAKSLYLGIYFLFEITAGFFLGLAQFFRLKMITLKRKTSDYLLIITS